MFQRLRPGTQDIDVRVALDIENPPHAHRLHDVRVAEHAPRVDQPAAFLVVGNHLRLVENDTKLARLYGVDDDFGVRRDDQLGAVAGGGGPKLMIDGVLQDHVQMRVRFVQQQHCTSSRVEKGQQHQHLLKSASRACDVQGRTVVGCGVFGANVCTAGVRWQQCIAEKLPDGFLQGVPRKLVTTRFHKKIAQDFARTAESEEMLDHRWLEHGFLRAQARHWRYEHCIQIKLPQSLRRHGRLRPYVDLLGAVSAKLHPHGPAGTELQFDFNLSPVVAVRPEQIEAAQRYRRECLPGNRRPGIPATPVEVVELPPPLEGERPRRDCLEHGRLSGVVGTGQHHVSRQAELRLVEALETADTNRADHVPVPVCGLASESVLGSRH